jgi:hypothetical protein
MADAAKPRPTDVPAAVRDAFSSNRMQSAWRMAQGATQEMRMPAIEAIFRMLEKEGLTFEDVMTAVLSIKPSATGPGFGVSMAEAFGGFEGIFSKSPAARTQPQPARRRQQILQGDEIPSTVTGSVTIQDERPTSRGSMVVFDVRSEDAVYGPIVCFTSSGIGALKAAAEGHDFVTMNVRQPNGINQMPSATGIRIV